MRPGLAALIGLLFFAGWLSAAWAVPLLLALLVLPIGNRARSRRGSKAASPPASGNGSPGTVERVATYTASRTPTAATPGQMLYLEPGRIGSLTFSGADLAQRLGTHTTAADCGCGDAA